MEWCHYCHLRDAITVWWLDSTSAYLGMLHRGWVECTVCWLFSQSVLHTCKDETKWYRQSLLIKKKMISLRLMNLFLHIHTSAFWQLFGHYFHESCWSYSLTHWPLGDLKIFFKMSFSNSSWIDTLSNSCETALRSMPQNPSDDKSTLVQVMAWCRQAASHYLSQCCPRSLSPYGVTRPQWVNSFCGCI